MKGLEKVLLLREGVRIKESEKKTSKNTTSLDRVFGGDCRVLFGVFFFVVSLR